MSSTPIKFALALVSGFGIVAALPSVALAALPGRQPTAQSGSAQAGSAQAGASRLVGAITAIDGKSITVKPDNGAPATVTISDTAKIVRTAPGSKTLAGATAIQITDLAIGDRVLIALHPGADGGAPMATTVVSMKQADIAQQQQAEQADWQKRGVGGLVKSVDTATGTVTAAAGARTWTIHTTPKTIIRRYAPDSTKFSDATPSTLEQIHPGDQLRARGDHAPDSTDIAADEILTGSFRNISATVISADAAANTVTVTDLATKKPVVIHVTADSQLHKLPPTMAQMLAARFKSGGTGRAEGASAGAGSAASGRPPAAAAAPATEGAAGEGMAGGARGGDSAGDQRGGGQRNGDLSQFLQRTPVLALSDLHKGDAVMIVATQGTPDAATAVTLIAGVEPILTASPSASQNMFSASWSLGNGAAAGEGTQ